LGVGLTTLYCKKENVEKPPRNKPDFVEEAKVLSWAVEPRKEEVVSVWFLNIVGICNCNIRFCESSRTQSAPSYSHLSKNMRMVVPIENCAPGTCVAVRGEEE
jgi:hypothetical protein